MTNSFTNVGCSRYLSENPYFNPPPPTPTLKALDTFGNCFFLGGGALLVLQAQMLTIFLKAINKLCFCATDAMRYEQNNHTAAYNLN